MRTVKGMHKSKWLILLTGLVTLLAVGYLTRDKTKLNQETITAVGSTALQPLVEAASQEFMKEHPNTFVNVQGGGSGTGLSQIQERAVDMGNSDLFAEEKPGIDGTKLIDNKIAVVGVAPIINKQVRLNNLTTQNLIDIFTGKVTNWRQIGGPDLKIVVINRTQGSGTRNTFEKFGINHHDSLVSQEQESSGTVKQIVASTPGAISYVAFGYLDNTVKVPTLNHVQPVAQSVINNKWPIWSYEHIYTSKDANQLTKQFIQFMNSDSVQTQLFEKLGYISVAKMQYERDWQGKITKK